MSFTGERALGMTLWETTQVVNRAFERMLAEVDGNRAVWFILLALGRRSHATQRELAATVGITEATLTHHLTALERRGWVTRTRDDRDRRVQRLEFTVEGQAAFERMLAAAIRFDRLLTSAVGEDLDTFFSALSRLASVADDRGEGPLPPLAELRRDAGDDAPA
ncbi:MarR family winged helix-turn-helix transcriptional regulator [Humibacter ginsenosidimutans]|nr:MarR family winged helix-turn-helix transcriptional regulator [Humibacter ginsenosidimutans]